MANCRIQNIKPPCGYRANGLSRIRLLDYDDFIAFGFSGGGLYEGCLVTGILKAGDYVEIETPETANYSSTLQNGTYTHTIETFISELSAEIIAQLHLAAKRRYVVFFTNNAGRQFVFGYEAGATVLYTNQTEDGTGSLVTITAVSSYPLFEFVTPGTVCVWGDFVNIWEHRNPNVACEWGDFINIWIEACANDYNHDYSRDYNCTSP